MRIISVEHIAIIIYEHMVENIMYFKPSIKVYYKKAPFTFFLNYNKIKQKLRKKKKIKRLYVLYAIGMHWIHEV